MNAFDSFLADCAVDAVAANDAAPTLAEQLKASCALVEAIERIEVIESRRIWRPGFCACDRDLTLGDIYRVTTAIPLRAQTLCSIECVALALLWQHHKTQDQSPRTVARVVAMIERSFARARERATGGV